MSASECRNQPLILLAVSALALSSGVAHGVVSIEFDYSLDTSGFFADPLKRQRLEQAAAVFSYADVLTAITPNAGNSWTAVFSDPATGSAASRLDMTVGASKLVVFVGARDLGAGIFGIGEMGEASAAGQAGFVENVMGRGQGNVSGAGATDVGPWGGSVAFSSVTDWYLGTGTAPAGTVSFYPVAVRELARVLGFGTADSWTSQVVGTGFTGPASVGRYAPSPFPPATSVPLAPDLAHWGDDVVVWIEDYGSDPLMSQTLHRWSGYFSPLDHAGMKDIGWEAYVEPYRNGSVPTVGDADGDGDVDLDDGGIWATNFTGSLPPGTGTAFSGMGDFDADKDVDLDDQGIWASNFTGSLAPAALIAAVPEPGIGGMVVACGAWLGKRRRS